MANAGTLLPSSLLSFCEDRFSLLPDSNDSLVPTWSLVVALLTDPQRSPPSSIEQLIEQLEIFSICIHARPSADFSHLSEFLHNNDYSCSCSCSCSCGDTTQFLSVIYPALTRLALELPLLFPSGLLPVLSTSSPSLVLSRKQIACLVVHQFLCTLSPPPWMTSASSFNSSNFDLHTWYTSSQPHKHATLAYLHALFTYFHRIATTPCITQLTPSEWPITLTLRSSHSLPSASESSPPHFTPLTIKHIPEISTDPSLLALPSGACVIFANKHIGFGATASQEEMHVGCSPEALPTALFTPPLQDDQVLVLKGVEAMITMQGYGRNATLGKVLIPDYDRGSFHGSIWRRRTMLFMDALELDMYDPSLAVPDLLPGHVDRELVKAYTAFLSDDIPYSEVVTGLWGCGAFGGDPSIKCILQWCAASLAGVPLTLIICEPPEHSNNQESFLHTLQEFTSTALQRSWRVDDVLSFLRGLHPVKRRPAKDAFSRIYCLAKQKGV